MVYAGKIGGGRYGGGIPCEMPAVPTGHMSRPIDRITHLGLIHERYVGEVNSRVCYQGLGGSRKMDLAATRSYRLEGMRDLPRPEGVTYVFDAEASKVRMLVELPTMGHVEFTLQSRDRIRAIFESDACKTAQRENKKGKR